MCIGFASAAAAAGAAQQVICFRSPIVCYMVPFNIVFHTHTTTQHQHRQVCAPDQPPAFDRLRQRICWFFCERAKEPNVMLLLRQLVVYIFSGRVSLSLCRCVAVSS